MLWVTIWRRQQGKIKCTMHTHTHQEDQEVFLAEPYTRENVTYKMGECKDLRQATKQTKQPVPPQPTS